MDGLRENLAVQEEAMHMKDPANISLQVYLGSLGTKEGYQNHTFHSGLYSKVIYHEIPAE